MGSSKPRIQLVLDWDGTITTADTTAVIGSRCLAKARELANPNLPPEKLPKPMQHYSEQYIQEYREWKESCIWPSEDRKTVDQEVSYLSQSKGIDQDSYLRVRSTALDVPGGMGEMERNERMRDEFMMDAGRQAVRSGELRIRDIECLKKLIVKTEEEGNKWGIVSVSWSRRFILGALVEAGLVKEGQEEVLAKRIRCNELLAPHHWEENRLIVLCSAWDKQDAFHRLLADWENENGTHGRWYPVSSKEEDATITIYVGDSSTDLGCLASPAVGMLISSNHGLEEPFNRLGVECRSIEDLPTSGASIGLVDMMAKLRDEKKPPHLICSIGDFGELERWISKLI